MAYTNSTLELVTDTSQRHFAYLSTDAPADVNTDGYFSDGQDYGMQVNDSVIQTHTTSGLKTQYTVLSLSSSDRSVDVSDGTTVSIATDTD